MRSPATQATAGRSSLALVARTMTTIETLLDLLPPPSDADPASVVSAVLNVGALELDAGQEDVDRLRRTHGFDTAYRLGDLAKIVALLGVTPLPWEDDIDLLRHRARALIDAQLAGAVGKREMGHFVVDYLVRVGSAIDVEVVRGCRGCTTGSRPTRRTPSPRATTASTTEHPRTAPPIRRFVSSSGRGARDAARQLGAVPYLYRWTEHNGGVFAAAPRVEIVGLPGGLTAVPIVADLTAGALIGWRSVVGAGRRLVIRPADDDAPPGEGGVVAELDDEVSGRRDVSDRLFSVSSFTAGVPFTPADVDAEPRLFAFVQGDNELRYLNAGLYNVDGIGHVAFALAPDDLPRGGVRPHHVRPLPVPRRPGGVPRDVLGGAGAGDVPRRASGATSSCTAGGRQRHRRRGGRRPHPWARRAARRRRGRRDGAAGPPRGAASGARGGPPVGPPATRGGAVGRRRAVGGERPLRRLAARRFEVLVNGGDMRVRSRFPGPVGRLRLVAAGGEERRATNSVLAGGAGLVAGLFSGQVTTPIDRVNVGFGTAPLGPDGTALQPGTADPSTLTGPVAAGDFTVTPAADTVRVAITATFTPTVALDGVTEAGLGAGDVLYNHVLFDPVRLEAGQAVSFFWEIDFPFGH